MLTRSKRSKHILKKQLRWKYHPNIYSLNEIQNLRNSKPYKFKVQNLWEMFTKKTIQELLQDKPLDIIISQTNSFTGNNIIQETMTYQQFHSYQGPLTLYLAQIQLDLECPKILNSSGNVYLWCSKGFTDSGWHYDSFENYLGVVEGIKIVYLKKKCQNWNYFEPITSENYNHMKNDKNMNGKFIILKKNELLYIPQGMFHRQIIELFRVVSYDSTIGINVWMEGIDKCILKINHYSLRYLMNELIKQDLKNMLKKQCNQILQNIQKQKYIYDIKNEFIYIKSYYSIRRTVKQKTINQLIGIYICLLMNMKCQYMVQFLMKLSNIFDLNYLLNLPQTYQVIIAFKLDEFSNSIQEINYREQFYKMIQQKDQLIQSLKQNHDDFKSKISLEIIKNHLGI